MVDQESEDLTFNLQWIWIKGEIIKKMDGEFIGKTLVATIIPIHFSTTLNFF
jgi:hypothetical protein